MPGNNDLEKQPRSSDPGGGGKSEGNPEVSKYFSKSKPASQMNSPVAPHKNKKSSSESTNLDSYSNMDKLPPKGNRALLKTAGAINGNIMESENVKSPAGKPEQAGLNRKSKKSKKEISKVSSLRKYN